MLDVDTLETWITTCSGSEHLGPYAKIFADLKQQLERAGGQDDGVEAEARELIRLVNSIDRRHAASVARIRNAANMPPAQVGGAPTGGPQLPLQGASGQPQNPGPSLPAGAKAPPLSSGLKPPGGAKGPPPSAGLKPPVGARPPGAKTPVPPKARKDPPTRPTLVAAKPSGSHNHHHDPAKDKEHDAKKRDARHEGLAGASKNVAELMALDGNAKKPRDTALKDVMTSALAAFATLGKGHAPNAKMLDDLRDFCAEAAKWLGEVSDDQRPTSAAKGNKCLAMGQVRHTLNDARMELMEAGMDARAADRAALDPKTGLGAKLDANADANKPVVAALGGYSAAIAGGQKNGLEGRQALAAIKDKGEAWLADKANAAHLARADVTAAIAGASAEIARIEATEQALAAIATPSADYAITGIWTDPTKAKGLTIRNADKMPGVTCIDGTQKAQIDDFLKRLGKEAAKSDVVSALVQDLATMPDPEGLDFAFGRNSCGFGDSAETMAVDMADLDSLPDEFYTLKVGGEDIKVGVTGMEILMHVIEERFYMQQNGGDYENAHLQCLSRNSLQNKWRRENGVESDSVIFDCQSHAHQGDVKLQDQLADFVAYDNKGIKQRTKNTKYQKDKNTAYTQSKDQTELEVPRPFEEVMAEKIKTDCDLIEKEIRDNLGSEEFKWDSKKGKLLKTDLKLLADESPKPEARLQALMKEYGDWATGLKSAVYENWKIDKDDWKRDLSAKRDEAEAFLGQTPNKESEALAKLRAERDKKVLNGAANHRWGDTRCEDLNCALTTLGAITGGTSTDVVEQYLTRKIGPEKAKENKFLQDHTMFWRAKNDKVDSNKHFGLAEGMPATGEVGEVGDAQLEGILDILELTKEERNTTAGTTGTRYEVIQAGIPDHGGMFPIKTLNAKMSAYPDGTQFQVFLYSGGGSGKTGGNHWVYGEKFNGKLIIEDYQKNKASKARPTRYVMEDGEEQGPNHATSDAPNVYTEGMFIAMKPVK